MANHFVKLDSEIYVNDFVKREEARVRNQQIRKAFNDCFIFAFGIFAAAFGFIAIQFQDAWAPTVQQWIYRVF